MTMLESLNLWIVGMMSKHVLHNIMVVILLYKGWELWKEFKKKLASQSALFKHDDKCRDDTWPKRIVGAENS